MGHPDPPTPTADTSAPLFQHTLPHLPIPQAQAKAPPPLPPVSSTPQPQVQVPPHPPIHVGTRQGAPFTIPPLPPRPKKPDTLAHKMAWGWVDTIIKFLEVNKNRAKEPPTVTQQAFRAMVAAVAEVDEQKSLVSFDVITSTGLHAVVKALANADVRAQKTRPSERAAGVVECWERRFPGRLSDVDAHSEGGMEVDG
ncbi:hypothetical protein C8T65DRAFT_734576 [Cerioporus squamosus]|nr:hypothetical protein C8T65DRAFT_734576 [Cerioporus squamosus]